MTNPVLAEDAGGQAQNSQDESGRDSPDENAENSADPSDEEENSDDEFRPRRFQVFPVPSISVNTDIGFIFGLDLTISRLQDEPDPLYPYRYRISLTGASSVKEEPEGWIFPLHNYTFGYSMVNLANRRLNIGVTGGYRRIVNSGYFGLVDEANRPLPSDSLLGHGQVFQYNRIEPFLRFAANWRFTERILLEFGFDFRYAMPRAYSGSKLESDLQLRRRDGSPLLRGYVDHTLLGFMLGVLHDTRDAAMMPTDGHQVELATRLYFWIPSEDRPHTFGSTYFDYIRFVPLLGERLVLASRFSAEIMYGEVPFYELLFYGIFDRRWFCGMRGLRGVPADRFAGEIKTAATVEFRSLFLRFTLFNRIRVGLGALLFFNVGFAWTTVDREIPVSNTSGAGSYGVGSGFLVQWGESIMLRVEAAYSPYSRDGGLPLSIYFAIGQSF